MEKLKFSPGNAKLKGIPSISLLAGYSCLFSLLCNSKVDLKTGKIIDGPHMQFRCFSASQESLFKNTRKQREYNFNLLRSQKTVRDMVLLLESSLPDEKFEIIRLHVGGDIFSMQYFDALISLAKRNPSRTFYAYTKSLGYWIARLNQIPNNLKLTASKGGKLDHLIDEYNLKYDQVVYSEQEAADLGLEIDHTDALAYGSDKPFALLIHGTQKAGSAASKAKQELANNGWTGYNRKAA